MVGRRNRTFYPSNKERQHGEGNPNGNGDLESGHLGAHKQTGGRPAIFRFRDAANTALGTQRREDLKQKLLHGINRDELENYRKSDKELKEMKNKKVRKFYEGQNDRLNDWMEVDAIVMSLADDVLDSMDPDPDNDGVRERGDGVSPTLAETFGISCLKKKRRNDSKRRKRPSGQSTLTSWPMSCWSSQRYA